MANTARRNDPADSDWFNNPAGFQVNHKYGFGMVDAKAAVISAKTWTNLPPRAMHLSPVLNSNLDIFDNGIPRTSTISVPAGTGITKVEFVRVRINTQPSSPRGCSWAWKNLEIKLTSPSGTTSLLAGAVANNYVGPGEYVDFAFGAVRFMGENPDLEFSREAKAPGRRGRRSKQQIAAAGAHGPRT